MLDSKLNNNQFVSDVIKDFPIPGQSLSIVHNLQDQNSISCILDIPTEKFICTKSDNLCSLLYQILSSSLFIDYDDLISNNTSSITVPYSCAILKKQYYLILTIDRDFVNNILKLDVTLELFEDSTENEPYITIVGKTVSDNDFLSSLEIDTDDEVPIKVVSISYSSEEHDLFELTENQEYNPLINNYDTPLIFTLSRFSRKYTDNKICLEIPAKIQISFDVVSLSKGSCDIDQDIIDAMNTFFNGIYYPVTTDYSVNANGIQSTLTAQCSVSINSFLFKIVVTHSLATSLLTINIKMIRENEVILQLSYSDDSADTVDKVFSGFTIESYELSGLNSITECENITSNSFSTTGFFPGYLDPGESEFAKFDYIFLNTLTGDQFIVKNVNLQGDRLDGGLHNVDDYVHFSGSLSVDCALPSPIISSYSYWNGDIYGKFSESDIANIQNITSMPVYDLETDNIAIHSGCIV